MPQPQLAAPNTLRDRHGRVIYTAHDVGSLGEAMADYAQHLDHISKTDRNLNVQRELLRTLAEVLHAHRDQFAHAEHARHLDQRLSDLQPTAPTPGGLRGLFARARTSPAERARRREGESLQQKLNLLAATVPDAQQILNARNQLVELRSTLYAQALRLRSRDIQDQLARQPEWLTNTLGREPSDPNRRAAWTRCAQDLAGRRIDLQITDPDSHGLPSDHHDLLRSITHTRVTLGLDARTSVAERDRELELSIV